MKNSPQEIEITPCVNNAKSHPPKQLKQLAESFKKFGCIQPIVLDKKGVIIAGHGRYLAMTEILGWTEKRNASMCPKGEKFIPYQIESQLSDKEVAALRIADNKLAESKWVMELVRSELKLIGDSELIMATGFGMDTIQEPDEDELPVITGKPKAKAGDIYQLGEHFIICGDSTSEEVIDNLFSTAKVNSANMTFTDPPYNIDYQGGMNGKNKSTRDGILNDKMPKSQFQHFLTLACENIVRKTKGGVYICMSTSELDTLKKAFEDARGHWQSYIVWVKNHFTLTRSDYQHSYEPILYGWPQDITNHYFVGARNASDVWEEIDKVKVSYDGMYSIIEFSGFKVKILGKIGKGEVQRKKQWADIWRFDKPTKSADHPTMKPIALCTEAIINSSQMGDVVFDPFLGSGSTLIACENAGRRCLGVELDERYVDIIIARWEKLTNLKAKKLK